LTDLPDETLQAVVELLTRLADLLLDDRFSRDNAEVAVGDLATDIDPPIIES
jgi:hypothetical protein